MSLIQFPILSSLIRQPIFSLSFMFYPIPSLCAVFLSMHFNFMFPTHQLISEMIGAALTLFFFIYCCSQNVSDCIVHCSTPLYHYLHLTPALSLSLFSPCRSSLLLSLSSYLSPVACEQTAKCEIIRFGKVTEIGGGLLFL